MSARDDNPLANHEKYRLERRLGAGAMGEVFVGQHAALNKPVVIKVILAELATSPTEVDRMRLEAQALARLDHPNIVRVTDFDQTADGRPFIVMDFLRGRTAAEELQGRGGSLPVIEALDIVRQAAAGLACAHQAGLVHRDLKLENLFLCDRPDDGSGVPLGRTVKVIDFGLAKTLKAEAKSVLPLATPTATGIVVGTPAFLAPEQAAGQAVDHRADIYGLGLVLYTLLALRGPFDDVETIAGLIEAQIKQIPAPPSKFAQQSIPPELDALVLRCLAKKPEDRPQTANELAAKLSSIITRLAAGGDATAPRSQPAAIARLALEEDAAKLRAGDVAALARIMTPRVEVALPGPLLTVTQPMQPPNEIQVEPSALGVVPPARAHGAVVVTAARACPTWGTVLLAVVLLGIVSSVVVLVALLGR